MTDIRYGGIDCLKPNAHVCAQWEETPLHKAAIAAATCRMDRIAAAESFRLLLESKADHSAKSLVRISADPAPGMPFLKFRLELGCGQAPLCSFCSLPRVVSDFESLKWHRNSDSPSIALPISMFSLPRPSVCLEYPTVSCFSCHNDHLSVPFVSYISLSCPLIFSLYFCVPFCTTSSTCRFLPLYTRTVTQSFARLRSTLSLPLSILLFPRAPFKTHTRAPMHTSS